MARREDDDLLDGPVPAPDDEPTAAELAHAKVFASLVDKAIDRSAGGRAPAAMSADDRALLEVATVIRASAGEGVQLAASTRSALVEGALRQAIGEAPAAATAATGSRGTAVVPIGAARRRWLPWSLAATSTAIAAAAIVALWVRAPRHATPIAAAAPVPASWTSRPADALVGPIAREHAGDAEARIDEIFADRLDGYRERTYARGEVR
jgi:hypothetical protein